MKLMTRALCTLAMTAHGAMAGTVEIDMVHVQSNPGELKLMDEMASAYEASHPDVKINIRKFGQDYKTMLSTALQSKDAPAVIYSWGGGVLTDQVNAGLLRQIDSVVSDDGKSAVGPAGVDAFSRDGKLYGIAQNVSEVVFWYNKELFAKAGVDVASMKTWDGLLAGVTKLKAAGITPISLGAKDKWTAAFYWDYLALRLAGKQGLDVARAGASDGFLAPAFVKAGDEFLKLAALEPFQKGFEAAGYASSSGVFGDGNAAMILMGDWNYQEAKTNSTSGKGLPDAKLGFFAFPSLPDQKGNSTDTLGGINGWVFSKNAPEEAVKFMAWYQDAANLEKFAKGGYYIPINVKAAESLENPFQRQIAKDIAASTYHAIFFDQSLGLDAGNAVNDVSSSLASKAMSAVDAAADVEDAMATDR